MIRETDECPTLTGTAMEMFLSYNPQTGDFVRKLTTSSHGQKGSVVPAKNDEGYIIVSFYGHRVRAHRLAWAWMTGRWPREDIDHINGDRSDNRFCNLREATRSQNLYNAGLRSTNKSGVAGVHFCAERKKYVAQIKIDKKAVCLGRFLTLEEAVSARLAAQAKYYGEFSAPVRQRFMKDKNYGRQ